MKSPNDYPQVKFRPGVKSPLLQALQNRSPEQTDRAFSETAKTDLEDYYTLLPLCLPQFTQREREVLWQALNVWLATPETVHYLWVEVEALVSIYGHHSVGLEDLVSRLRTLSRFECWAIYQAVKTGLFAPGEMV